jgi:hypothetical protein
LTSAAWSACSGDTPLGSGAARQPFGQRAIGAGGRQAETRRKRSKARLHGGETLVIHREARPSGKAERGCACIHFGHADPGAQERQRGQIHRTLQDMADARPRRRQRCAHKSDLRQCKKPRDARNLCRRNARRNAQFGKRRRFRVAQPQPVRPEPCAGIEPQPRGTGGGGCACLDPEIGPAIARTLIGHAPKLAARRA